MSAEKESQVKVEGMASAFKTFRISSEFPNKFDIDPRYRTSRQIDKKSKPFQLEIENGKYVEAIMTIPGKKHESDYTFKEKICTKVKGSSKTPFSKIVEVTYKFDTKEDFKREDVEIHRGEREAKSFVVTVDVQLPVESVKETDDKEINQSIIEQLELANSTKINQSIMEQFELADPTKINITCNEQSYSINKLLLKARSSVFRRILGNPKSKEAQTNKINFDEHGIELTKLFCQFLNKFELDKDDLNTHAMELFALGEMYEIEPMTRICTSPICQMINMENFVEVAKLGYLYNNARILGAALNFFLKNKKEVLSFDAWNELTKTYPDMGWKMLEAEF